MIVTMLLLRVKLDNEIIKVSPSMWQILTVLVMITAPGIAPWPRGNTDFLIMQ